jgi:hypothetical protein
MLRLTGRRRSKVQPADSIVGRGGPAVLDDSLLFERQQVLDEFCAYERELLGRTPTPEELAEYERRKEQVREHGRDCIRRSQEALGLPPLD